MKYTLLLISLVLLGCGKANTSDTGTASSVSSTVGSNSPSQYQCTFTGLDRFKVGTDPTQDFNVTNVSDTSEVESTNCTGVSTGVISSQTIDTISRSGSLITLVDSGSSDIISISGTQASIPAADLQVCTNGVQATGTLQSVELDTVTKQIRVHTSWSLIVNGCTRATVVSGLSAPAPVVIVH